MTDHEKRIREALEDCLDRIEKSEFWWMDCPDRGGFDAETIRAILALRPQSESEPFGYFRATPDGWEDCSKHDEGAKALYERPQAVPMTDTMPQDMGQATIMGDCIHAGIFEDEVSEVKSAVVIKFESNDKLRDFLRWHHGITAQGAQGGEG